MSWLSYKNYAKEEKNFINSRWVWFIGKSGEKDMSLQICSRPSFRWSFSVDGCDGEVRISFWFLLTFYFNFTRIFPEWIYTKEYNQFADKEAGILREAMQKEEREEGEYITNKPSSATEKYYYVMNKNKKLKGRARTRDKGWIRTGERNTSLSFHDYHMWWNIWRDDSSWSSDVPFWRNGNIDFVKLLKGKSKVSSEVVFEGKEEISMPEGKYLCKLTYTKCTKTYKRWWSNSWNRFEFEFGFENDKGEWIKTPIPHWGKGENSWDCGMDGTYSISLGSDVRNLDGAKQRVSEHCLKYRERYGKVDFSNVKGIENGVVKENLLAYF